MWTNVAYTVYAHKYVRLGLFTDYVGYSLLSSLFLFHFYCNVPLSVGTCRLLKVNKKINKDNILRRFSHIRPTEQVRPKLKIVCIRKEMCKGRLDGFNLCIKQI